MNSNHSMHGADGGGSSDSLAPPLEALQQAVVHHQAGRLSQAAAAYRAVLRQEPLQPDANHNLAILDLQQGGEPAAALPMLRLAWSEDPENLQFGVSLLRALVLSGQGEEAQATWEEAGRRGIKLPQPALLLAPSARNAAGDRPAADTTTMNKALADAARTRDASEALRHFREAYRCGARDKTTLTEIARLELAHGLLAEALRTSEEGGRLWPDEPDVQLQLCSAYRANHRPADAVRVARVLVSRHPGEIAGWIELGNALASLDQPTEACAAFERALELDGGSLVAFRALGQLLTDVGDKEAAVTLCQRILTRQPGRPDALYALGTLQGELGNREGSEDAFTELCARQPSNLAAKSSLLCLLQSRPERAPGERLAAALAFGAEARRRVQSNLPPWQGDPRPKRLRVGLASGDLREHPVGFFIEGVLGAPAAREVDWFAYSSAPHHDGTTARLRELMSGWHNMGGLSEHACAQRMREDSLHVLLDLSGHTTHNLLPVFAWRPAPLQVSWLGYWGTTGLREIDYLIADPLCLPQSLEQQFVEKPWHLPVRYCLTAPREAPAISELPATSRGRITFGCFQAFPKITDATLSLWSRILDACEGSTLRIQNAHLSREGNRPDFLRRLQNAGISPSRVELAGATPRARYLAELCSVDINLDTFPYTGGTTTCEALWMGVPTVSQFGDSMLERQGLSILACAGLRDWAAASADDYVAIAISKARHLTALSETRRTLRNHVSKTPLFDTASFARLLVDALFAMWRKRSEKPPGHHEAQGD